MKLLAIDGNSLVNRAFYGVRHLSASDGTPTNAVYGFISILQKLIGEDPPDALCVTFDTPVPTFRHEQYDGYKATRSEMPGELAVQMPILKDVLDAMNIRRYELAGWEADDLLGAIAKNCEAENWACTIVTGDKDSLQLVSEHTIIKNVKTKMGQTETKVYTPDTFIEEYGFEPALMIDLKALMGDSSDNIPGVAGVGEKTALDLIRRFGKIENIFDHLDTLDIKDAVRKKLEAGRERAFLSYELATIQCDVPLEIIPTDSLRKSPDNDKLYALFKRLGFSRFIKDFGLVPSEAFSSETIKAPDTKEVTSASDCDKLLDLMRTAPYAAVQIDAEFFDSVAVAVVENQEENSSNTGNANTVSANNIGVYTLRKGITDGFDEALAFILSACVQKIGHDVKDMMRTCLERGLTTDGWIFDTALAAYFISPTDSHYSIERISERYCGFALTKDSEENGQMSLMSDDKKSLGSEAFAMVLLYDALSTKLKELKLEDIGAELLPPSQFDGSRPYRGLYEDVDMPLCDVLAQTEYAGFLVDKEALIEFGKTLAERILVSETQIYAQAGETFNINSPKQLGSILFEKLMLPAPKKTKTGYSTNIEVLDSLTGKHPIIAHIKDYRELTKLKSTYADGLLKVIMPNGRIHTHFGMTVTATGRLSSTEPNLQNIPVRKAIGGELRKMFVAGEGMVLVGADYSQIELRLLAHISGDSVMIAAFEREDDIHAVTASQVFRVPLEEVTAEQRFRAKAVNFGIVYGISAFSLANDIGVFQNEAKNYIDRYLENYAGVRNYMSEIVKRAKALGYVETLFGRRRYLPELKSANFNMRSFGERVALNMPIQGTAADIIKIAMINVSRRLKSEGLEGKLILQVHDELIVECPECEADLVGALLREEMEGSAHLSVPLIADTHVGKSWYDVK
ncbi:MAG: DNA polymerase I [Oscillospiraceae bacterium]|nr:DNA polymerase I [Oscillospiraceae bacterium]